MAAPAAGAVLRRRIVVRTSTDLASLLARLPACGAYTAKNIVASLVLHGAVEAESDNVGPGAQYGARALLGVALGEGPAWRTQRGAGPCAILGNFFRRCAAVLVLVAQMAASGRPCNVRAATMMPPRFTGCASDCATNSATIMPRALQWLRQRLRQRDVCRLRRRICAVAVWASFGKCFAFSACIKTSSAPAASACCHLHAVVVSKTPAAPAASACIQL